MKTGVTISCIGHALAIGCALVAISAQPMEVPPVDLLPVQFISEKDFTKLTQGVKNAPQLKIEMPKPLADKVDAPKAVDQLAPKVADKPEIKTDSSKASPEPKLDIKPDPKQAQKPDVKPDPKPDPQQAQKPDKPKTPEYKPDQIADLLKKDAAKTPAKPADQSMPQKADAPKFDANQVAELLDKRDPQRQLASNATLNDVANLGAASGAPDAQMSQSEIDALRARISSCWSSAARHRRQFQGLCRAARSVQAGRHTQSRTGSGRSHRIVAGAGARRQRQARAAVVSTFHHAQAGPLRSVEGPRAQIRSP